MRLFKCSAGEPDNWSREELLDEYFKMQRRAVELDARAGILRRAISDNLKLLKDALYALRFNASSLSTVVGLIDGAIDSLGEAYKKSLTDN